LVATLYFSSRITSLDRVTTNNYYTNQIMKKLLWTTIASFIFAGFAFSADCDKCKKKDGAEAKKEEGTVAEGKCKKKCDKEEEKEEGTLIAGKCKKRVR